MDVNSRLKNMSSINSNAQLRYLVQWFAEWSELQRSDFLSILAENYAHKAYVNGIVNSISSMNCRDKPMSLFECRIKLFKEWFTQWNIEMKESFLKKIEEIDPSFIEKLNAEIEEKDTSQVNDENCLRLEMFHVVPSLLKRLEMTCNSYS